MHFLPTTTKAKTLYKKRNTLSQMIWKTWKKNKQKIRKPTKNQKPISNAVLDKFAYKYIIM